MDVDKLPRLLNEIRRNLVVKRYPLRRWHTYEGWIEPQDVPSFDFRSYPEVELPHPWGGYDVTTWFYTEFDPTDVEGWENAELHIEVGEALVYLNGEPWAGSDRNHRDLFLGAVEPSSPLKLAIEAYNGLREEKSVFQRAEIRVVDRELASAYHDFNVVHEMLELVQENEERHAELRRVVKRALSAVDPRRPGSPEWRSSILEAARRLREGLGEIGVGSPGTVWPVGHSHIDVTWLWTVREVKRKCGRTFSTALRLMDEFPEFLFVQSQPALYEFVKQRYPSLYEQIKRRIREGKWQPVGAMWVEADCNISSGEALVRQLLYGKRFFEREFGVSVKTLWLPDVFGYTWALPQLLRKAEIEGFFTAKIGWNKQNPFPYSSFWWRGVDGSEILAHLSFHPHLYNIMLTPTEVWDAWKRFRSKEVSRNLLLPFGYGDGGGGPTRTHLENLRRLEMLPEMPEPQLGGVEEFFEALRQEADALPTWDNELYFEYHRGVYTSHANVKRGNRKGELALRDAEILASLAYLSGHEYPADELGTAWKKLLTNQFHDILPGSSIAEVYDDTLRDLQEVIETGTKIQERSLRAILSGDSGAGAVLTVFNTLSWRRTDVAVFEWDVPEGKTVVVTDEEGEELPAQVLAREGSRATVLLLARDVPAFGSRTYRVRLAQDKGPEAPPDPSSVLEIGQYRLSLNRLGEIESLVDRENGLEILAGPGNVFEAFVDFPHAWEAWDIDADYVEHPLPGCEPVSQKVISHGPVATAIETELRLGSSMIRQRMFLYRELRRIDFDTKVDWHERRTLLKVRFPVNARTRTATYEIQFGAITRATHRNTSWEQAQYEVPAQRWADLSDGGVGLALMNDCKYGYDARDNVLRLTLLRSVYPPDPNEPGWTTNWKRPSDQGEHRFLYSILPHFGSWQEAHLPRAAYDINVPFKVVPGASGRIEPLVQLEPLGSVIVEAVKKAEDSDDLILRLYESEGGHPEVDLRFFRPVEKVWETNLLERQQVDLACRDDRVHLRFGPFEVKTLKVRLRR